MDEYSIVSMSIVAIVGVLKKIRPDDKILELESLVKEIVRDFEVVNADQLKKKLKADKMIQSVDKIVAKIIDVTLELKDISGEINGKI